MICNPSIYTHNIPIGLSHIFLSVFLKLLVWLFTLKEAFSSVFAQNVDSCEAERNFLKPITGNNTSLISFSLFRGCFLAGED